MSLKLQWIPKILPFFVGLLLAILPLQAFHIVGGEITYEDLGGGEYEVKLTVYRDCLGAGAELDDPAYIFIFNDAGTLIDKLSIPLPGNSFVSPPDNICIETLPDVCVEKATYTYLVNIPITDISGATLVYQRYSRNSTLKNIDFPDETGSSYTTYIPPYNVVEFNSSPVFNEFPPTVICASQPLWVDQSAYDLDGDSLSYELCDPLIGGSDLCPQPGSPTNCNPPSLPAPPPPYPIVDWSPGYDELNPLDGELAIDPLTGELTGFPTETGQYVVGICVNEWRNGELINTVRRDFQFNVADCEVVLAAVESDDITPEGQYVVTDCSGDFIVDFVNTSLGATEYEWTFEDTTLIDINPSYEYPDSGQYTVLLTAYSPTGLCSDQAEILVNLYPTHLTNFSYEAGCANEPVTFADLSTTTYGEVDSWTWAFGNGDTSYEQHPTLVYNFGGTYPVTLTTTTDLGCIHTVTQNVNVQQNAVAKFELEPPCVGSEVQFTDDTLYEPAVSWSWTFGDPDSGAANTSSLQNPVHVFTEPGTYLVHLEVSDAFGCVDDWQKAIVVYPEFEALASEDQSICEGDTIQFESNADYDWFDYTWSPAEGLSADSVQNPLAYPLANTTYTLSISDPNGCIETDELSVEVFGSAELSITGDEELCLGESTTLTANGANVVSYTWTSPDGNTISGNSLDVSPETNSSYSLIAVNEVGCESEQTFDISVIQPLVLDVLGEAGFCVGGETTLSATVEGAESFSWSPSLGITSDPNSANVTVSPAEPTIYTVTATNSCFSSEASVEVDIYPLPEVDAGETQLLNVGEIISLEGLALSEAIVPANDFQYEWTPTDGLTNPNDVFTPAQPLENTLYTLTATDANGCVNSDTVSVIVTQFINVLVPTGFSPNSDGINDFFNILAKRGVKEVLRLEVYNRWGEQIYNGPQSEAGWDGTYKGKDLEIGSYAYYVEVLTYFDEVLQFQGNVTLLR